MSDKDFLNPMIQFPIINNNKKLNPLKQKEFITNKIIRTKRQDTELGTPK